MRSRIVLWGENEKDEKVLIALELLAAENVVDIHVFPESQATELFYNLMMNEWRNGNDVEFPENHEVIQRPLTAADSLLPDSLKVARADVISRAQTEWHFVVLSSKLYQAYKSELEDLKERVEGLTKYDGGLWEELKGFWGKVQQQMRDKNLFREHINYLKEETNGLFDKLKEHRKTLDDKLKVKSEEASQKIEETLNDIEAKIEKGLGLKPLFQDLKDLQNRFKDADLIRKDRNRLRKQIDKAFKVIKEKRFGDSSSNSDNKLSRIQRRYDGLVKAISKMKSSIGRDKKDIEFEERRISSTDGQLEAQIRTAKLKMIKERIDSKQEKLDEMLKIEENLVKQINAEKEKIEKAEKLAAATEEAKERIAEEIAEEKAQRKEEEEDLKKAAEEIKASKTEKKSKTKAQPKDNLVSAVGTTLGESLEDVVDTIKAIAEVVSGQVEELIDDVKEAMQEEE